MEGVKGWDGVGKQIESPEMKTRDKVFLERNQATGKVEFSCDVHKNMILVPQLLKMILSSFSMSMTNTEASSCLF